MQKKLFFLIAPLILSACTIKQTIEPAGITQGEKLCIIENPAVRSGFLIEFKSALTDARIPYNMVGHDTSPSICEWTTTYTARWSWDVTLYMSYAEIKIFYKGELDGEAIYDSTQGSGNLNKFIDAEPKIRELVNELLIY